MVWDVVGDVTTEDRGRELLRGRGVSKSGAGGAKTETNSVGFLSRDLRELATEDHVVALGCMTSQHRSTQPSSSQQKRTLGPSATTMFLPSITYPNRSPYCVGRVTGWSERPPKSQEDGRRRTFSRFLNMKPSGRAEDDKQSGP